MEHLRIFLRLYANPVAAMSDLLDKGSLGAATLLAVAVAMLSPVPLFYASLYGLGLASAALVLLPAALLALSQWRRLGSVSVVFRRDFAPAAICLLSAWTACYLPIAAAVRMAPAGLPTPVYGAALAAFLILAALALRTVTGAPLLESAVAVGLGWGAAVVFLFLPLPGRYLFSPFLLFLAYRLFASDIDLTLRGLGSHQRLKSQLEAAALNPNDADAQYQLGLIYQQRRNYAAAIERFQKAAAIDPTDPGALFELGRIAREQNRPADAVQFLKRAIDIDGKFSSSDPLREYGAACLETGNAAEAVRVLALFVQRRPFDPEGQYWYGRALSLTGQPQLAREAWQAAVEAADTAPGHRRREVSKWRTLAAREL